MIQVAKYSTIIRPAAKTGKGGGRASGSDTGGPYG